VVILVLQQRRQPEVEEEPELGMLVEATSAAAAAAEVEEELPSRKNILKSQKELCRTVTSQKNSVNSLVYSLGGSFPAPL